MKNVVIVGAAGRMGKTIIRCLQSGVVPELKLSGAVDLWDSPDRGKDAGRAAGGKDAGIQITSDLAEVAPSCDVVIDFSGHQGTSGNASRIADWKKALVIGTTGLTPEEKQIIETAAAKIPVVLAPNMSLGVNLLFSLVEKAGATL